MNSEILKKGWKGISETLKNRWQGLNESERVMGPTANEFKSKHYRDKLNGTSTWDVAKNVFQYWSGGRGSSSSLDLLDMKIWIQ